MKAFLDTSVLVAACIESHEHHERSHSLFARATPKTVSCAAHSLAELYATLTRLPGELRLNGDQALLFLESVEEHLDIVSLDAREYRDAIRAAATAGITGGTIYDSLIGSCALKARASTIYTWDTADFRRLGQEIAERVRTP